ncbi:MAG: hypothetical protein ATN35_13345 [Epulopiscium sp. Nele67-Bin004]|nr:MAG: hypothetical protein ATN35_13345 [Epulopiscium sp. Nele67-Bin004]
MIILFLCTNVALFFLYLLMVNMISTYFDKVQKSVEIYTDDGIYKIGSETEFLRNLITNYKESVDINENVKNLEGYIKKRFNKDFIGAFSYQTVEKCVLNIRWVMVTILTAQIILYIISQSIQQNAVILNVFLCIVMSSIFAIKDISKKKLALIVLLEDYLLNGYDLECAKKGIKFEKQQLEIQFGNQKAELNKQIDTQQQLIQELEEEVAISQQYVEAAVEYEEKQRKVALNNLTKLDVEKFFGDMGIKL